MTGFLVAFFGAVVSVLLVRWVRRRRQREKYLITVRRDESGTLVMKSERVAWVLRRKGGKR